MWANSVRDFLKLLFIGPPPDGAHDRLHEARTKLDAESAALTREVRIVGKRPDPIETVIRNIRRTSRKR